MEKISSIENIKEKKEQLDTLLIIKLFSTFYLYCEILYGQYLFKKEENNAE